FEPASAIIEAERAARPSLPFGSCADPAAKTSLTLTCGSAFFWRRTFKVPASAAEGTAGASEARPGRSATFSGRGSFDRVVTTIPESTKYFFATAWTSAGVTEL